MGRAVDLGSPFLDASLDGDVLLVRIARPERRNAMTLDMYRGVKRAAVMADRDPEVSVLCLTGTGEVFASGGDMAGGPSSDPALAAEHDPTDHFPFRHLERCAKPVLAAVNGLCHAGGLNLALYSDVVVASDRATFRVPELLRGVPDPYMSARLADHVGVGVARYLLFTAATLSAEEALHVGLVGRVVPHDRFQEAVVEGLDQLRRLAPRATTAIKGDINRSLRQPDVAIFSRAVGGAEMHEGMTAFVEKRPPRWTTA